MEGRQRRFEIESADLVDRIRRGEPGAFEALVRENGGRLLSLARRYLRNEEDARDTVQEAFLAAHRSIASFRGQSSLSTWLHRIAVNAALMKLRRRKSAVDEGSIEDLLPGFLEDGHAAEGPFAHWGDSAERMLESKEISALVREAIDRLPDNYRTVLLLRDIEEMSGEETAAALGITANAVKIRLHRARQALRTLLSARLSGSRSAGQDPERKVRDGPAAE